MAELFGVQHVFSVMAKLFGAEHVFGTMTELFGGVEHVLDTWVSSLCSLPSPLSHYELCHTPVGSLTDLEPTLTFNQKIENPQKKPKHQKQLEWSIYSSLTLKPLVVSHSSTLSRIILTLTFITIPYTVSSSIIHNP